MTGPVFVDTNLLLYALDLSKPEKRATSREWLATLWRTREARISFQVLVEFYVNATRKIAPGLSREAARRSVGRYLVWEPVPVDRQVIVAAWAMEERYRVSWWDALILGAAELLGCRYLLTEDLQHGQAFDGVTAINPFLNTPDELS
jgi:predicted nucleic acid-binding protein